MSDSQEHSPPADRPVWQRLGRGERIIALILTALGVLVAVLAWLYPRSPDEPTAGTEATVAGGSPAKTTTGRSPGKRPLPGPATSTHLDTLAAQAGGANLVALPRELHDQPGYNRPVIVQCPSNENNDKVREVNYLLRGRYLTFSAMVRPFFATEQDAAAHVSVLAAVRERDGTLTWTARGNQFQAAMDRPAPVTADVEGAQEMSLQVRCEHPEGLIILTDAVLGGE